MVFLNLSAKILWKWRKFRENVWFFVAMKFIRIVFLPKGAGKNKILTLLKVKILTLGMVKFLPLRPTAARARILLTFPRVRIFFTSRRVRILFFPFPLGKNSIFSHFRVQRINQINSWQHWFLEERVALLLLQLVFRRERERWGLKAAASLAVRPKWLIKEKSLLKLLPSTRLSKPLRIPLPRLLLHLMLPETSNQSK